MSDFYEEQISDLEDHVGGLEIDLKEANQEIERLREALEQIANTNTEYLDQAGWDFNEIAIEALKEKIK